MNYFDICFIQRLCNFFLFKHFVNKVKIIIIDKFSTKKRAISLWAWCLTIMKIYFILIPLLFCEKLNSDYDNINVQESALNINQPVWPCFRPSDPTMVQESALKINQPVRPCFRPSDATWTAYLKCINL